VICRRTFPDGLVKLPHWLCYIAAATAFLWAGALHAAEPMNVRITFLAHTPPAPASYEMDPTPQDEGLTSGCPAIKENDTTGAFTGQHYGLNKACLAANEEPVSKARALVSEGINVLAVAMTQGLNQRMLLDTLGSDEPESECRM